MTPINLLYELENLLTLLLESGVAISTTKVTLLQQRAGFQRVTWATSRSAPGELFRTSSATVSEYRDWIACQGYSAVLFDGSIIQFTYDFEYSDVIRHRLLYFPCPFDLDEELLYELSLVEVVELLEGSDASAVRLRSPLRFDYDPEASSLFHPASHMTFQWAHCRLPVMSPISPGHFIRFIFRNFYPAMWRVHDFIRQWPQHSGTPTLSRKEEAMLHINAASST